MRAIRLALALTTATVSLSAFAVTAEAATFTSDVTLTAEHGVVGSADPRMLSNTTAVGDGSELDASHETSNPEGYTGAIDVDIDPAAETITVTWSEEDNCYTYIELTITSAEMNAVTLVSDALFDAQPPSAAVVSDGTDGTVTILWGAKDSEDCYDGTIGNTSVFSYGQPEVTTTTTTADLPTTGPGSASTTALFAALVMVLLGTVAVRAARRPATH